MFKGARVQGGDYFDDKLTEDAGGVFAGLGIDDYEGVKEQVSPDGLTIRMNCRACNKPREVTLDWKELTIVGSNGPGKSLVMPPGWDYSRNNAKLYPANIPCNCGAALCPQITPDEAKQRVVDAVSQGLVQPAQVQAWVQQVDLYRQQGGGA